MSKSLCFLYVTTIFLVGCTDTIDPIVVPIERTAEDINRSMQSLDTTIPVIDAEVKMEGTQIKMEKRF